MPVPQALASLLLAALLAPVLLRTAPGQPSPAEEHAGTAPGLEARYAAPSPVDARTARAEETAPLAASAGGAPAAADSTAAVPRLSDEQEARAQRLEGRLKCPVCRVQSVRESSSFMALEMRAKIRELIAAGKSDAEVLRYFVDRYGDYILLEPRKGGFGIWAYALPLLAVVAGAVLLLRGMRRRRRTRPAEREAGPPAATPRLSSADRERVEEELKRYTV